MLRRNTIITLVFCFSIFGGLMFATVAYGLGITYWDDIGAGDCDIRRPDDNSPACAANSINLIVGQTQYVQKTGVKINAYFHSPNGKVKFNNLNFCAVGTTGDDSYQSGGTSIDDGTAVTRAIATDSSPGGGQRVIDSVDGLKYTASSDPQHRCDDIKELTLTGMPQFGPNIYYATIEVKYLDQKGGNCSDGLYGGCDNVQNAFYMYEDSSVGSNNFLIASVGDDSSTQDGLTGYRTTAQEEGSSALDHVNYVARFGAPCDINPAGASARLSYYDLDLSGSGGAQDGAPIIFKLYKVNKVGSQDNEILLKTWREGSGPDDIHSTPNAVGWVTYDDFKPGGRYIWQINDVFYNNTIQFSTPYNGINYYVPCDSQKATVKPTVSLSPGSVVNVGDDVTATFGITNTSGESGNVKYTPIFWQESVNGTDGANPQYNPGLGDVLIKPAAYPKNNNLQGPVDVPSPGGFTQDPTWNVTAANPAAYKSICASMELSGPDGQTTIGAPNPAATCVPIGKLPTLQLQNGDLRTGGSFPSSTNQACKVTAHDSGDSGDSLGDFSLIGHNFGGTSPLGSHAKYGIFSTGRSVNFGSSDASPTGGDISRYLTFANLLYADNPNNGFFYSKDDGATTGTVTTHCFSNVLNGHYAFGNKTDITDANTPLTVGVNSNSADTYNFTGSNQKLIISGGTVAINRQRIIHVTNGGGGANNVIEIDANIILAPGQYTQLASLPAFVLLSEGNQVDTRVLNVVTQLDGIYAVNGNFNTCDAFHWTTGTNQLGSGPACDSKLKVNGAVMVGGRLFPYRTAGQDTSSDATPAELFDLRPDIILGDYGRSITAGGIRTTYQTELPPRF